MTSLLPKRLSHCNALFIAAPLLFSLPIQSNMEVHKLRAKADVAYKRGDYGEALSAYLHLLNLDPDAQKSGTIAFKMGYCYYQQRHFARSVEVMREAAALDSLLVDYCLYFVAKAYLGLQDTTHAMAVFEDLLSRFPYSPLRSDVLYELGSLYQFQGDLNKATDYFTRLINLPTFTGNRADLWYRLGLIYEARGDTAQALAQFRRIMERSPKDVMAFSSAYKLLESKKTPRDLSVSDLTLMAQVMKVHREYDRAIDFLTQAVAKLASLPKSAALRYEIADTYVKKRDYAKALEILSGLLTQAADTEVRLKAMLLRAQVRGRQGENADAVREYLLCASTFAERSVAISCLWRAARLAEDGDQLNTAIDLYHRIANDKMDNPYRRDARWREGFCWYKLGDYQRAVEILDDLRRENPRDASGKRAAYWAARCRQKMGNKDAAAEIYRSLADSLDVDYHVMLSVLRLGYPYGFAAPESLTQAQRGGDDRVDSLDYKAFERPLRVFELLGKNYAQREIAALNLPPVNRPEELQRRRQFFEMVEAFGRAYTTAVAAYEAQKDSVNAAGRIRLLRNAYPRYFREQVNAAARKYGVSPYLVWAIMRRESAFNPESVSSAGAMGLIQVMPETGAEVADGLGWEGFVSRQLLEPDVNVVVGVHHLRGLLNRFDDSLTRALAAYNGGPQNVKRWAALCGSSEIEVFVENIDFRETRSYVKGVLVDYWMYMRLYDSEAAGNKPFITLEP